MNVNLRKLHDTGQRLWLDHITRELLTSGRLASYIAAFSVTGLTSNPTLFEHAIAGGDAYDDAIHIFAARGLPADEIFFELALEDLTHQPICCDRFSTPARVPTAGSRWRSRPCLPTMLPTR